MSTKSSSSIHSAAADPAPAAHPPPESADPSPRSKRSRFLSALGMNRSTSTSSSHNPQPSERTAPTSSSASTYSQTSYTGKSSLASSDTGTAAKQPEKPPMKVKMGKHTFTPLSQQPDVIAERAKLEAEGSTKYRDQLRGQPEAYAIQNVQGMGNVAPAGFMM